MKMVFMLFKFLSFSNEEKLKVENKRALEWPTCYTLAVSNKLVFFHKKVRKPIYH
jgi:hypothetical protein